MDILKEARKRVNDNENPLTDEKKNKVLEARQKVLREERNLSIAIGIQRRSEATKKITQNGKVDDEWVEIYPFPDGFLVHQSVEN